MCFEREHRQTEQISYFRVRQYMVRGSWCYLQTREWAGRSLGAGWELGACYSKMTLTDDLWTLLRMYSEFSLAILPSVSLDSFPLALRSLSSSCWLLSLRLGDAKGLCLGCVLRQVMHLWLFLLFLTQWKQILWPQLAFMRLWVERWQVKQFLGYLDSILPYY